MDTPEEKIIDGVLCRKVGVGMWVPVTSKKVPKPRGGKRLIKQQRFVLPVSPVDELVNEAQRLLGLFLKTQAIAAIGANATTICRIRKGMLEPSPDFILRVHDATDMSIERIREILQVGKLL